MAVKITCDSCGKAAVDHCVVAESEFCATCHEKFHDLINYEHERLTAERDHLIKSAIKSMHKSNVVGIR